MAGKIIGKFFINLSDADKNGFCHLQIEEKDIRRTYPVVDCPYTKRWFDKLTDGDLIYITKMYPDGTALTTDENFHTLRYRT